MLGFSFSEVVLIGIVALVAVGPKRLPGMLKNFGQWMRKLRKLTTEVRAQTGIDDILKAEGIQGGITELRSLMRGQAPAPVAPYRPFDDPYRQLEVDLGREYPPEGVDAKGALPDDLTGEDEEDDEPVAAPVVAEGAPPPAEAAPPPAEAAPPPAEAAPPPAEAAPVAAEAAPPPPVAPDPAAAPVAAEPAPVAAEPAPAESAPAGKPGTEAQP